MKKLFTLYVLILGTLFITACNKESTIIDDAIDESFDENREIETPGATVIVPSFTEVTGYGKVEEVYEEVFTGENQTIVLEPTYGETFEGHGKPEEVKIVFEEAFTGENQTVIIIVVEAPTTWTWEPKAEYKEVFSGQRAE